MKRLVTFFLCVLLVFSSYIALTGAMAKTVVSDESLYIIHTPIRINSDADFTAGNGVTGGTGTAEDPWIIEGWEIDAQGGVNSIYVANTTEPYIILDCEVYGSIDPGNDQCANIEIRNSTKAVIENVTSYGSDVFGFHFEDCENITARGNDITDSVRGIYYVYLYNSTLDNNTLYSNDWYGISGLMGSNVTISNNTAYENEFGGFNIDGKECQIINNYAANNNFGISISDSEDCEVMYNKAENNSYFAFSVHYSTNNNLSYNEAFFSGFDDYYVTESDYITLYDNYGFGKGIEVYDSQYIYLIGNHILSNASAIELGWSDDCHIEANYVQCTVNTSNYGGIELYTATDNSIIGNNISGYDSGISLEFSDYTILSNNEVSGFIGTVESEGLIMTGNQVHGRGIVINMWKDYDVLSHWNSHAIDDTNLVNGKPVQYLVDESNIEVDSNAGQVYLIECSNVRCTDLDISKAEAVSVLFSDYIYLSENSIDSLKPVNIFDSTNINMINNTFNYSESYIDIEDVSDINIQSNKIFNARVQLNSADSVELYLNEMTNSSISVNGNDNRILDNVFIGSGPHSSSRVLSISGSDCTVIDNYIDKANYGMSIGTCDNLTLRNNVITNCNDTGIYINGVTNSDIKSNYISNAEYGMYIVACHFLDINKNNVNGSQRDGIRISSSSDNNLTGNNLTFNEWNGLYAWDSDNLAISSNNVISNNLSGIEIRDSNLTSINNNTIDSNLENGLRFYRSSNNTISMNQFTNNGYNGTCLLSSSYCLIKNNSFIDNDYCGLFIDEISSKAPSINSTIYNNNFILNREPIFVEGNNIWDNGYPSGGNYYQGFDFVDAFSGQDQDIQGMDWIADEPFNISKNNTDNYPLMKPALPDYCSPWIVSFSPNNNSMDLPVMTNVTIKFSEPMDTDSVIDALNYLPINENFATSYGWNGHSDELVVRLSPNLDQNTSYNITINTMATDIEGNSMDYFQMNFSTMVDFDMDGITDSQDDDDDNDGTYDIYDDFPLDPTEDTDTDNDGIGDNADTDDDGDGVPDTEDFDPMDPDITVDPNAPTSFFGKYFWFILIIVAIILVVAIVLVKKKIDMIPVKTVPCPDCNNEIEKGRPCPHCEKKT